MNPSSVMNPATGAATAPQMGGMPTPGVGGAADVDTSQFGNYSDWAKQEMAKGFSPEQLQQHLAQSGAKVEQPHSGNWLTHLLPTIGSVAIPALGALLAPETGGLSLVAAAGLSGLGAAGGKLAENATEGKDLGNGVVGEGVMGAAGGAAGGVAGKFLGKASGALAGRAEEIAGQKVAQTAAEDAIEIAANTYKDISPQLQKAYKAKDSLAHVTKMGYDVADPSNLVHVSNTSNDILNETLNRALANSGPVDLSHYPQIIKDALAKEAGTLGSYEKVALARGRMGYANTPAAKLLQQLEDLGAGVAKSTSDPNELRTLTTKLGELAQDAKPSVTMATGAIDPAQKATYNAINSVRDQVKSALYSRPEVGDAIKGEVGNIVANPKMNISQELADHLNDVITKSSDPQGLLSEISRNINIGKLGEEGKRVGEIVTSTGGKARAAAEAGLGNPGLDTHPLLEAAGTVSPHAGVAGNVVNFGKHAASNPAILNTLSRIGAMGEKLAPAAGSVIATAPNMQADPVNSTAGGYGMGMGGTNDTMGGNMQGSSNGAHSYQDLINAMEAQAVLAPSMGGGASSFLAQIAPQLQKNQLALSAINGVPGSFANAGGAQGTGGIMSRISGLIPGTAAHTYNAQQHAAAAQLAQAMGISPEAAMGLLPQLMQNQGTAGMTQGILSNMGGQLAY
jgi:hypothetical protein